MLVGEVQSYGERKTSVENAATRLSELSRKEDCDVVQNLIMTVQDRFKKLLQHTTERGKTLEDVKRHAKQVFTSHLDFDTQKELVQSIQEIIWQVLNFCAFHFHSSMNHGTYWWTGWRRLNRHWIHTKRSLCHRKRSNNSLLNKRYFTSRDSTRRVWDQCESFWASAALPLKISIHWSWIFFLIIIIFSCKVWFYFDIFVILYLKKMSW